MRSPKSRIDLTQLREYMYSALYNSTSEARKKIPSWLMKFVRSEAQARKFIARSNLDEKLQLLSYLGIDWYLTLVDKGVTEKKLNEILKEYHPDKKLKTLKDVVESKIFITSNKEILYLLEIIAQSVHTTSYILHHEIARSGYNVNKWDTKMKGDGRDNVALDEQKSRFLATLVLNSALVLDRSDFLIKHREIKVKVLLFLYPFKHTFLGVSKIYEKFNGEATPVKITGAVRDLLNEGFISRSLNNKAKEVSITAKGIEIVHEVINAVMYYSMKA